MPSQASVIRQAAAPAASNTRVAGEKPIVAMLSRAMFSTATAEAPVAAPALPEATVPAAEPPSQRDTAIGGAVVIGFALLFVAIIAAAVIQLRRAARDPALKGEELETGALEKVHSVRKP